MLLHWQYAKGIAQRFLDLGAAVLQFLCLQVWPYERQILCVCLCEASFVCVCVSTQTRVTGSWPVGQVMTLLPAPSCGFLLCGPPLLMIAEGGSLALVCVCECLPVFMCVWSHARVRDVASLNVDVSFDCISVTQLMRYSNLYSLRLLVCIGFHIVSDDAWVVW